MDVASREGRYDLLETAEKSNREILIQLVAGVLDCNEGVLCPAPRLCLSHNEPNLLIGNRTML
jgi:hypothetical protein